MEGKEMLEFLIMLKIEEKANSDEEFFKYMKENSNIKVFNIRYKDLLDKFLNLYAVNTAEKSE